jgi:phage shock protein A
MAMMTMGRAVTRWWKYLAVKLHVMHDEHADPKVQLEQAIQEAREQHQRLTEQAANVIANQRQAQTRLDRAVADYEKAEAMARRALLLADHESRSGDSTRAARFVDAAEAQATKANALESGIREQEQQVLQATHQADAAKAAVMQNASLLQEKLAEREQLLTTLDQAKMHEAMNAAVRQLTSTLGEDVPTFEQVRHKIDARLARAQGMAELTAAHAGIRIDARMLEVEQAQATAEAQVRIARMRLEMGLPEAKALEAGSSEVSIDGRLRAVEDSGPTAT